MSTGASQKTARYRALLDALDAGEDVDPGEDAWACLLLALHEAKQGRYGTARAAIESALEATDRPEVRYAAAHLLYVTRDHDRSLSMLRDIARRGMGRFGTIASRDAIALAGRLGWAGDVRTLLAEARRQEPRALRWCIEAARNHVRARAWSRALEALEAAVALEPKSGALWMELAGVAAEAGARQRALDSVERALALESGARFVLEGARVRDVAGDVAGAEALLEEGHRREPADGRILLALAEHRLWRRDDEGALRWVAVVEGGEGPANEDEARDAERIRAAVRLFGGDAEGALAMLQAPGGDYRRPLLRAEALWKLGRVDEAHDELTRASMSAPGFLPLAWVLRIRANFDVEAMEGRIGPDRFTEIRELLVGLVDGAEAIMRACEPAAVRDLLDRAIDALGGNRTVTPTRLTDGEPVRLPPITGERFAARRALESIRSLAPEDALDALDAVVRRFPDSALVEAHRGELLLWLGRFDEARASLERSIALSPRTRWSYIGLSAIELVEERWEDALATNERGIAAMGNTVGAAVYVHRGEALLRLGRLDEANDDLDRALAIHPSRVSARLLAILARHARGAPGDADVAAEALAIVREQAVGLLSDAAAAVGVPADEALGALDVEGMVPVLERALVMLGANRSSTVMIYRGPDDAIRFVPHWPHSGRTPHDADADDLARVETFLQRGIGLLGPRPVARVRRRGPRDDSALIEAMKTRGYVALRGAVPTELCERMRRDNLRRLRMAPDRFLKDFDADRDQAAAQAFDPDDPSTFWRERIDILGNGSIRVSEAMPRLWDAVCALVGGAERLETEVISDYLILNLREPAGHRGTVPGPGWPSWHIDDPREDATLHTWTNGLIGILLVDDVAEGAGETFIAPESIRLVARLLERNPEGVDLVSRQVGPELSRECREFVGLHGSAGDIFLLHPFMLHTASPNDSGRVRWMANPTFYLRAPLDLRPSNPDPTPLEATVLQHLGAESRVSRERDSAG